jgi:hypothetical protein
MLSDQGGLRAAFFFACAFRNGVSGSELMDMSHLVRVIDAMEEAPKPRGTYKKRGVV